MRNALFIGAIAVLLSEFCLADEPGAEAEVEAQFRRSVKNIPSVVKQYADAVGCEFHMKRTNVVPYELDGGSAYIAVMHLDNGCSGGSAMSRPVFVALRPAAYQKVLVDASYSAPDQTSQEFPSLISRIYLKGGEIWFEGKTFDLAKDPICCPSVNVVGRVKYQSGKWVPVGTKVSPNITVERDTRQSRSRPSP